ncbi:MAG: hypothetical protein M5U19_11055 [Microthrixaceae bacterium]|nr:hypothetical protein [Microthrixaceae bacterium]
MSQEVDALLARVDDPALRADLRRQFDLLRTKRSFGLVFESHLPERVRLPSHPVRRGTSVAFRDGDDRTWTVDAVHGTTVRIVRGDEDPQEVAVDAVVVVAEFGEPIYPGMRHLGSVHRGGDKPAHVLVNGENHQRSKRCGSPTPARSTASTSTRPTTPVPVTGSTTTTTSTATTRTGTRSGSPSWSAA